MSINDPNRQIQLSDLDDYNIQMEAMLDDSELMKMIEDYSGETSMLEFLRDIRTLRGLFSRTKRDEKMYEIWNKYIVASSPYQLNIPHSIIRKLDGTAASYDYLEVHILLSLRDQYLHQFLQSKIFREFIVKKKLSFLPTIGYAKLNSIGYYMRTIYMMNRETYSYEDFLFIRQLAEDNNNYKMITPSHYRSELRYQISNHIGTATSHFIHKFKQIVHYGVHETIAKLTSVSIHEPYMRSHEVLTHKHLSFDDGNVNYSYRLSHEVFNFRFIHNFDDRDSVVSESGCKFKDNTYCITRRSIRSEPYPNMKRIHLFGGYCIKPMTSYTTLITKIVFYETQHCLIDKIINSERYSNSISDIISSAMNNTVNPTCNTGLYTIVNENKF